MTNKIGGNYKAHDVITVSNQKSLFESIRETVGEQKYDLNFRKNHVVEDGSNGSYCEFVNINPIIVSHPGIEQKLNAHLSPLQKLNR